MAYTYLEAIKIANTLYGISQELDDNSRFSPPDPAEIPISEHALWGQVQAVHGLLQELRDQVSRSLEEVAAAVSYLGAQIENVEDDLSSR